MRAGREAHRPARILTFRPARILFGIEIPRGACEAARSWQPHTSTAARSETSTCTAQRCLFPLNLLLLLLFLCLSLSPGLPNSLLYHSISVWCSPILPLRCSLSLSLSQLCLGAQRMLNMCSEWGLGAADFIGVVLYAPHTHTHTRQLLLIEICSAYCFYSCA